MADTVGKRLSPRRIAVAVLICFGQPLAALVWLKADGPIAWIFVYCLLVFGLFFLRSLAKTRIPEGRTGGWAKTDLAAKIGLGLFFLFGAGVIIIGLDITPASAYLAWFQLVQEGIAGGTLAYMFTVKFAYFASIFGGLVLVGNAAAAIFNLAAVDLLICAVLLDKPGLAGVGAILFLAALLKRALVRNGRPRGTSVVALLQLSVVAALIALPLSAAHLRNRLIDDLFAIRMEQFVARIFPNFPFLYNVPGYGYSLTTSQIGDRPALTSRPVFDVTAPAGSSLYIRTGAYDTYTGTGWELSQGAQRDGEREAALFAASVSNPPPVATQRITFNILIDFYSSLPHTLGTVAFRFPNTSTPSLSVGSIGTGFISDSPLRKGTEIVDLAALPGERGPRPEVLGFTPREGNASHFTLNYPDFRFGRPRDGDFEAGGSAYEQPRRRDSGYGNSSYRAWRHSFRAIQETLATASRSYGLEAGRFYLTPWERQADLQVGKVSRRLRELARSLGRGQSEQGTIDSIRNYLTDNYQYSLETWPGGPYEDAVSNFLFASKKGFCVQFASAFVLLARLNGIPARYVTGFLAELPAHSTQMTVTGLSAHAWAETWSNHRGWVTQEATPPMVAAASGASNILQTFNPTDSSYTQRQLEAVLGGRLSAPGATNPSSPSSLSRDLSKIARPIHRDRYTIASVVLGLALLLLLIRFVLLRLAPVDIRFQRVVRKILRRSRVNGLADPAHVGWTEWSRTLVRQAPGRAVVASRAAVVIHRSSFAGDSNGRRRRDVVFLEGMYRSLLKGRKRGASDPRPKAHVP